ncbi:uncharacterized protein RAG0_06252 [Rhynchosporium agropyri]|uniref:Uncharacterized protein n=1 Tax=Rhynchosporium agropyri TaxID=914238 RepID=A0A1E1KGM7_9HELO|nr:uncharacterized protein RAG0_06252 [Rhynchosporium agropyri]
MIRQFCAGTEASFSGIICEVIYENSAVPVVDQSTDKIIDKPDADLVAEDVGIDDLVASITSESSLEAKPCMVGGSGSTSMSESKTRV